LDRIDPQNITEQKESAPMEITRADERPHKPGPADWFTGEVDMLEIVAPSALLVTFGPRARTAWHAHPRGQTLHILSGLARIAREGGAVEELRAGDAVTFAPGQRHWHGAGPAGPMSHIAIAQPDGDGKPAYWQEHVTEEEYGA